MNEKEKIILRFGADRPLAHQVLFQHRHPNETPGFHYEMIQAWHSSVPNALFMAFRGAAKSTLAEEAVIVESLLKRFNNGLIIGETAERANDRLRAIKHELENNDLIAELFGDQIGDTWNEDRIILRNGVIIQAHGRGQSLRGVKHLDYRPDRLFCDDMEDEESTGSEAARAKLARWFFRTVLPALAPDARVRVNATPLDAEALAVRLAQSPNWVSRVYPIEHVSPEGERQATWPARFPLEKIDEIKQSFIDAGDLHGYMQEYMCQTHDETARAFTREMFRIEPTVRSWHTVQAFYDPARTTNKSSSLTGKVVFSWVNNRLIVWEGNGFLWKPDELVNDIFETDERFQPMEIGVEEDGLNEFLLQPLRQEQARRRYTIPYRAFRAPKGKIQFIEGLQPFFKAGEVIFAQPLPGLEASLLAFPTGKIDAANALAYALRMRPGNPVYDGFTFSNVREGIRPHGRSPLFLAVNASPVLTGGALLQMHDGILSIFWDTVREGSPGETLENIIREASVYAQQTFRTFASPKHFLMVDNIGLRAAARKLPLEIHRGGNEAVGREELREYFKRMVKGGPALLVNTEARWTLNALSGGYARALSKAGVPSDFASEGPYRLLMEGIESFAAMLRVAVEREEDDNTPRYAYTQDGRRFLSALPRR